MFKTNFSRHNKIFGGGYGPASGGARTHCQMDKYSLSSCLTFLMLGAPFTV